MMSERTVKLLLWFGILFNAGLVVMRLVERQWWSALVQVPAVALCVWSARTFYRRMKEVNEDQ